MKTGHTIADATPDASVARFVQCHHALTSKVDGFRKDLDQTSFHAGQPIAGAEPQGAIAVAQATPNGVVRQAIPCGHHGHAIHAADAIIVGPEP